MGDETDLVQKGGRVIDPAPGIKAHAGIGGFARWGIEDRCRHGITLNPK